MKLYNDRLKKLILYSTYNHIRCKSKINPKYILIESHASTDIAANMLYMIKRLVKDDYKVYVSAYKE